MRVLKIGSLVVLALAFTACGSAVKGTRVNGSAQIGVGLPSGSALGVSYADFGTPTLQYVGDASSQNYQITMPILVGTASIPFTFYVSPQNPKDINAMMDGNVMFQVSVECASSSGSFCHQYAFLANISSGSNSTQMAVLFQDNNGSEQQLGGIYGSNYGSIDEALADLQ